ncbi:hypothetical protein RF11_04099 [Thelohanellus kitauei]|uniref:C2H2-type domain-containing protein n=1 Tax=Thelohanellus kitauei TaxID=669202 RepID=A0A0C2J9K8_THEKT|nr:hypothetical protein RF11_04099 [Thelohanellus kitauei]
MSEEETTMKEEKMENEKQIEENVSSTEEKAESSVGSEVCYGITSTEEEAEPTLGSDVSPVIGSDIGRLSSESIYHGVPVVPIEDLRIGRDSSVEIQEDRIDTSVTGNFERKRRWMHYNPGYEFSCQNYLCRDPVWCSHNEPINEVSGYFWEREEYGMYSNETGGYISSAQPMYNQDLTSPYQSAINNPSFYPNNFYMRSQPSLSTNATHPIENYGSFHHQPIDHHPIYPHLIYDQPTYPERVVRRETPQQPIFQCPYEDCTLEYHKQRHLDLHIISHTHCSQFARDPIPKETFTCPFTNIPNIEVPYTGIPSFVCDLCPYKCEFLSELEAHKSLFHKIL